MIRSYVSVEARKILPAGLRNAHRKVVCFKPSPQRLGHLSSSTISMCTGLVGTSPSVDCQHNSDTGQDRQAADYGSDRSIFCNSTVCRSMSRTGSISYASVRIPRAIKMIPAIDAILIVFPPRLLTYLDTL